MTQQPKNITQRQAASLLQKIFGPEERTVVLVVDQDKHLVDYRVEDLSKVLATLDLNGFGQKYPHPQGDQ
jgi:uncharacterized protein YcgL (UPF0745 family)